jgi:C1A family cysteine protease
MVVIGYIDFEKKNSNMARKYGGGLLILRNSWGKGKSQNQKSSIWDGAYFMSYKYANLCTIESFAIKNVRNAEEI